MSVFIKRSRIWHCSGNNDVFERWYLNDGKAVLFSQCDKCYKPIAIIIDTKTKCRISKIFSGLTKINRLKKYAKKKLVYTSEDKQCHIYPIAVPTIQ